MQRPPRHTNTHTHITWCEWIAFSTLIKQFISNYRMEYVTYLCIFKFESKLKLKISHISISVKQNGY